LSYFLLVTYMHILPLKPAQHWQVNECQLNVVISSFSHWYPLWKAVSGIGFCGQSWCLIFILHVSTALYTWLSAVYCVVNLSHKFFSGWLVVDNWHNFHIIRPRRSVWYSVSRQLLLTVFYVHFSCLSVSVYLVIYENQLSEFRCKSGNVLGESLTTCWVSSSVVSSASDARMCIVCSSVY